MLHSCCPIGDTMPYQDQFLLVHPSDNFLHRPISYNSYPVFTMLCDIYYIIFIFIFIVMFIFIFILYYIILFYLILFYFVLFLCYFILCYHLISYDMILYHIM